MLRYSVSFFVLGLIAMLLGWYGVAGLSFEAGRIILVVFFVLSLVSFFFGRSKAL